MTKTDDQVEGMETAASVQVSRCCCRSEHCGLGVEANGRPLRGRLLGMVALLVLFTAPASAKPLHAIWEMQTDDGKTKVEFTAEWVTTAHRPDYANQVSQYWLESLTGRNMKTGATFSCRDPLLTLSTPKGGVAWGGFIAKCSGVDVVGGQTGEVQMTSLIEPIEGSVEPKNLAPGDKLDIRIITLHGSPTVKFWRLPYIEPEPVLVQDGRAPKRE